MQVTTKMDELHQHILKTLRKKIVADMDVHNSIIKPLQLRDILTDQHITKIEGGSSKERKAEILLDILPSCGPNAFNYFRQALRHHYEWLSEEMDNLERSGKPFNNIKYSDAPTLPPISPSTVERQQKMYQLKDEFTKLKPNGYILLHGMKGFGRSCLAASTLNDVNFVRMQFNNEVYWIKFGYKRSIEEETLIQLFRLYHLVKNLEILPLSPQSEIRDSLIHFLKDYFSKHPNALLILDDVWDRSIIETFDFECKTLVISTNREYLWGKRPSVIRLNDGFTEAETLGLFAKVLDTEVDSLPHEAKQIHAECKGMPLLISMFSAQFEEFKHDMKISPKRWRYYLESLKNNDKKTRVIKDFWDIQKGIFDTCIQQLSSEMRNLYEELVIFREDVNITPETLEILWEEKSYRVEEMMLDLCHKSLAAKEWNDKLHSYIYGVHDLLLCHLREKFSPDDIIKKHRSLIEKYRKYCNGDFSKLPGDNYSYSYVGYHLEQAQLYDEFPRIYLDFDFIESAIIYSGLNNLLIDLNIYKKYITNDHDPIYEARFNDLEKFLEEQSSTIAEHRRKRCLDIVQIAMNHPYQGYVKDTALKLAGERSNRLYVFHNKKLQNMDMSMSEEMSTEVMTTCFTSDPDQILFGNRAGEIYSWDSVNKRQTLFSGHSRMSCIKKIVVSSDGDCFLSLDDQGIVKLFKLSEDENEENKCISPKQKQVFWKGIYTSEVPHDHSSMVFSVPKEIILDMVFAYDNSCIVTCTDKGTIVVWDRRGNVKWQCHYPNSNSYLKYVAFTTESNLLHIMDEVDGVLISYNRTDKHYNYLSQYNPNLEKKKIIFFRNVPERTNSLLIVTEKKAVYVKFFVSSNSLMHMSMHSYNKQVRATVEDDKTVYVCASLTNDGQYIVLADSSGFINVWNADDGIQPVVTYKSRVSSLDTYWLKEGYHIICGSENRLLHKWKLPVEGTCLTTKKPLFDAKVQKFGSEPDIIVTETLSNTIVVLNDDKKVAETEPINEKINNLILHEGTIIYVTDKGMVNIFDVKSKQTIPALKFSSIVELIKVLDMKSNVDNNYVLICRESNENLRVWKNGKISYLVPNAGYIISIHQIDEENVVTVTKNGVITVWNIVGTNWAPIDHVSIGNSIISNSSCLSYQKSYLTVLNENGCVIVYKLHKQTITFPPCIKVTEYCRKMYPYKLRCCEISQNEKYLALGFENGHISIIDILMTNEICQLRFHTDPVTQLNWAPSIIEVPILLSVSSDEIVWWNIVLAENNPKKKRRSGMSRSASTPFPIAEKLDGSLYMSTSQSVDSGMYDMRSENNGIANETYDLTKFWKSKEGKDPEQPALLAVVELSSNFFAKVCVSADFTKFVTVDIYGSISTFTLCGYN